MTIELDELQTQLCILESHQEKLLERIRQNEAKLSQFHALETTLLSLNALRELVEHVIEDTKAAFDLDLVSLVLVDEDGDLAQFMKEDGLQLESVPSLILLQTPQPLKEIFGRAFRLHLGEFKPKFRFLLPGNDFPSSVALLPLVRRGQLLGCLNLGSHDPSRYSPTMATDFLDRLRAILSVCLENTKNFEQLRRTSLYDTLTGVNNRRFFEQRLGEEIDRAQRSGEPLSCLFLDIDHFKQVNDTYGHQTGDLVLAEIASQIRSQLRNNDVLARYGGEEFVALLSGANEDRAMEVAERIRRRIANHSITDHNHNTITCTLSVGVAEYNPEKVSPVSAADIQRFIELADQALYAAKHRGRNRVESGGVYQRQASKAVLVSV